jgi:hypothetical protein
MGPGDDPFGDLRQAAFPRRLLAVTGLLKWLMCGPIGTAATRLAEIDVEPLDTDALFGEAVAKRGEILDEHRADGSSLRFKSGDQSSILHADVERQCAELRGTQPQANLAAVFRRRERAGYPVK